MKVSRSTKIGIFVAIVISFAIWGLYFLKGMDLFNKESRYVILYKNIQGLVSSNPVQIKGLKVGIVSKIEFTDPHFETLTVEIIVKNGIKIPKGTIAKIYSSDLMGSKSIELLVGNSNEYYHDGDTLQSEIEESLQEQVKLQMLPIKRKAESLMSTMDSILTGFEYVFNQNTKENLLTSIENIKKTFENLEHSTRNIDTLVSNGNLYMALSNIESITSNIKAQNKSIANILNNTSKLTDTIVQMNISKTLRHANSALIQFDSIASKISRGDGTIGQLLKNDTLFDQLKAASSDLDKLLIDVKSNPKKYVHFSIFGSKSGTKSDKQK